jgi:hypothetical protein
MNEECLLCEVVDNICDKLPTEEAKRRCKELSDRVMKGEVDGKTARRELLKHVDPLTLEKVVRKVLSRTKL